MVDNHATTEAKPEKRGQELDDRSYMGARRELRQQIAEGFKNRIKKPVVSGQALFLRWAVFSLAMAAGLVAGYMGVESYKDLNKHVEYIQEFEKNLIEGIGGEVEVADIELEKVTKLLKLIQELQRIEDASLLGYASFIGLILRGTILLLLGFGFVAYAINWLRLAHLDDVRTLRYYESYGYDIDRASFVIETIMEVGEKETTDVPDAWVEGVCRNLFSDKGDDNYGKMPSNAAAMLFESITGAKFGPEGTEVTMKRPAPRRFWKIPRRGRLK